MATKRLPGGGAGAPASEHVRLPHPFTGQDAGFSPLGSEMVRNPLPTPTPPDLKDWCTHQWRPPLLPFICAVGVWAILNPGTGRGHLVVAIFYSFFFFSTFSCFNLIRNVRGLLARQKPDILDSTFSQKSFFFFFLQRRGFVEFNL